MNNMLFDSYLKVLAVFVGATVTTLAQRTKTNQNFIFFQPDEMRAESLGCYGHPISQTPNFGELSFINLTVKFSWLQ